MQVSPLKWNTDAFLCACLRFENVTMNWLAGPLVTRVVLSHWTSGMLGFAGWRQRYEVQIAQDYHFDFSHWCWYYSRDLFLLQKNLFPPAAGAAANPLISHLLAFLSFPALWQFFKVVCVGDTAALQSEASKSHSAEGKVLVSIILILHLQKLKKVQACLGSCAFLLPSLLSMCFDSFCCCTDW